MQMLSGGTVSILTTSPYSNMALDVNGHTLVRGTLYAGAPNYGGGVGSEGGRILFGGTNGDNGDLGDCPTGGCIVSIYYQANEMSI